MAPITKTKKTIQGRIRSSSSQTSIKRVKGENFYRDAKKAAKVKMLSGGKPVYGRDGKIVEAAAFQKTEADARPGRVQPDRRWFGNTRVISQTALEHFRESLGSKLHDPYSVLLRRNKLPMSLIDEAANPHTRKRSHIVETEPFHDTFGPKAQRKRPRLDVSSFEELGKITADVVAAGDEKAAEAMAEKATEPEPEQFGVYQEPIYQKGTSRRIYGELYKVIDSSDVVLHVLDARDPLGTLCKSVLDYMRKEKAHKQIVLIVNKCDLVPNWVTARYISHLSKDYPTIAFHASPNHSFGKGSLIQLLRQFSQLHSDKKQISVGLIGYPNVGKSSIINTLKASKVCKVAPVPGETKVWQYITLTRRIYLIDCPGIVPAVNDSDTDIVLKGVVRVEALPQPSEHIAALLQRVRPVYLSRTYGIPLPSSEGDVTRVWDVEEFLEKLARIKGRLLKRGEADIEGVAKIVLNDWVRGKVPYFVPPPDRPEQDSGNQGVKESKREKGEEKRLKPVPQKLGGIIQKNKFEDEDVRALEDEVTAADEESLGDLEVGSSEYEDSEGEVSEQGSEVDLSAEVPATGDTTGPELGWEEVLGAVIGPTGKPRIEASTEVTVAQASLTTLKGKRKASAMEVDDSEGANPRKKQLKEQRMTTSKRKTENFYTGANVKNRNRNRLIPNGGNGKARRKK